ncbi:MAG: cytochrome c biogenesis protein CcsA [Burkholderiales bacterium]|nr:cytochrome c biogenesis protein CcsA [Burkholderiales bacterium]OUT76591.1 MAG: hypothetical protein CBB82_07570 [Betaproteobacteria bacterium TMED22]
MKLILLHLATTLSYSVLSLVIWRQLQTVSMENQNSVRLKFWANLFTLVPIGFHFALTYQYALVPEGLQLGLGNFTSLIVATACLLYTCQSLWAGKYSLPALSLPFGAIVSLLPILDGSSVMIPNSELPMFKLHLILSTIAYGVLSVSVIHAIFISYLEKNLYRHKSSPITSNLPPLLKLEDLLFTIVLIGFVTLTAALISGGLISRELQNAILPINHKIIFSFASWLLLASLLIGQYLFGWRGKAARKILIMGFLLLILAYLGSRFVSEIILRNPSY